MPARLTRPSGTGPSTRPGAARVRSSGGPGRRSGGRRACSRPPLWSLPEVRFPGAASASLRRSLGQYPGERVPATPLVAALSSAERVCAARCVSRRASARSCAWPCASVALRAVGLPLRVCGLRRLCGLRVVCWLGGLVVALGCGSCRDGALGVSRGGAGLAAGGRLAVGRGAGCGGGGGCRGAGRGRGLLAWRGGGCWSGLGSGGAGWRAGRRAGGLAGGPPGGRAGRVGRWAGGRAGGPAERGGPSKIRQGGYPRRGQIAGGPAGHGRPPSGRGRLTVITCRGRQAHGGSPRVPADGDVTAAPPISTGPTSSRCPQCGTGRTAPGFPVVAARRGPGARLLGSVARPPHSWHVHRSRWKAGQPSAGPAGRHWPRPGERRPGVGGAPAALVRVPGQWGLRQGRGTASGLRMGPGRAGLSAVSALRAARRLAAAHHQRGGVQAAEERPVPGGAGDRQAEVPARDRRA